MITAEELLKQRVEEKGINYDNWIKQVPPIVFAFAIEFAELHVKTALKRADNHAKMYNETINIKDAILNAYPLENIK